jgi:8-oxo-dGTP diphosphatase
VKSVTVEVVVLALREGRLSALLARRPGSVWALPGAPVREGGLAANARTALVSQTGIVDVPLEQLYTFDRQMGDGLSVAYLALIAGERHPLAPGADVVELRWFPLVDLPPLPDDAREVLRYGQTRLRAKAAYAPIAVGLLPETFTIGELQAVYETLLETPLDPRNFRRDVLAAGVVAPVGRARSDGPGRPAQLYRATGADFAVVARERRVARAIAAAQGGGGA